MDLDHAGLGGQRVADGLGVEAPGAPSSSTRPASRNSSQPERSISAATSSEAMASARSKPVTRIDRPAAAAASDA